MFQIDFEGARKFRESRERQRNKVDPFPPQEKLSTDILNYIGGIMDSEGSFYFVNLRPAVSIYNNNFGMLERIAKITGGNPSLNHKKSGQLRIAALDRVKNLCERYIPFMHLKTKQATKIIEACDLPTQYRETLSKEVSAMNARDKAAPRPIFDDKLYLKEFSGITSSDAAYFCGFLEGDGTIIINRQVHNGSVYFYPHIHLYNTAIDPLVWIQNRFGGKMEVRKRDDKCGWMYCLSFEDQAYVAALIETVQDHFYEKKEIAQAVLNAAPLHPSDRVECFNIVKECNSRFRGLHKFVKMPDGTYVDGVRSPTRPHKTHKGVPLKPQPIKTDCDIEKQTTEEVDF